MKKVSTEFYTLDEVCKILNLCRQTVVKAVGRGDFKAVMIGRQWRFPKESFKRSLEKLGHK